MNEVIETLVNRRSCKAYSARQVDEAALQEILRAGLYAPSGMGRQSVTFVVLQDAAEIRALSKYMQDEIFVRTIIREAEMHLEQHQSMADALLEKMQKKMME